MRAFLRIVAWLPVLAFPAWGCGDAAMASKRSDSGGGYSPGETAGCHRTEDCPVGLECRQNRCVTPEGLPPETETPRTFLRPAASAGHVYVLSPDGDSVAIIDTEALAIRTVAVPGEPFSIALAQGADRAVVLSRRGRAVSVLDRGGTVLHSQPTARRFGAVSLAPDGRSALVWTPEGQDPDAGAEGIVGIVDVAALAAGTPAPIVERAAGRRHTDVFFRTKAGASVEAVVVGKEEIAVVDLFDPEAYPLPFRVVLPPAFAEIATREAQSPPGGALVLLRSVVESNLAVFEVDSRTMHLMGLPAPPSDLDLSWDGRLAVAVLRSIATTAWFPVPEALGDASLVRLVPTPLPGHGCDSSPCTVAPGQAVVAPDAASALLFTNAAASEAIGRLDLVTGAASTFELEKLVRTVGVSPDTKTAVVVHRSEPGSTVADAYEHAVDVSEGYSLVDLCRGGVQLKLTDDVPPQEFAFTAGGKHAGVTLRKDATREFLVDSVDLETLVTRTASLASAPGYCGALPDSGSAVERIWVSQEHAAGRMSFVGLADGSVRTVTGFELNSEIRQGGD